VTSAPARSDIKAELARGQAEAVRMLDAWAGAGKFRAWVTKNIDGNWYCLLEDGGADTCRIHHSTTPEAARANAAEAIRSEVE
jgi:hypothetical protein